jgi:hypothetical protein
LNFLLRFHFFILASLLCLAWFVPRFGDRWFRRIEEFGTRFARKKWAVVVFIALATVLPRAALLWVMPIPAPNIHDEFSYLLAGDTFAHGRLANPPHPMWLFLETFHVLQHPTYASIYPPAQGGVLAFGQLLGNPWVGVLLSMAAMGAAVTWAMQAWLPPRWALLGGVLVVLRIGLISDWMNSYWGGAVAATGGALVIGALPRIRQRLRLGDAVLMALGAALLANSRPLEGLIFCAPVAAAVIAWLFSKKSPAAAVVLPRLILPIALVLMATLGFIAHYNWRVTGSALLFPETLDEKVYTNFPLFIWQAPEKPLKYNNPQFEEFYNVVARNVYPRSLWTSLIRKSHSTWLFFLGSALSIPFLAFPRVLCDKRIRFLLIQCLWSGLGLLVVVWFFPHYVAPLTATIFMLIVQMLRHLRLWTIRSRPVGVYLTRLVILLLVARVPFSVAYRSEHREFGWNLERAGIVRELGTTTGKHLIIVSYSSGHIVDHEWVYNAADIDRAQIVWARQIPGRELKPLLEYFRERRVWILEADAHPIRLLPLSDPLLAEGESVASK